MQAKDELGRRGERLAVAHLRGAGFRVLDRNWRCRAGELDAVALDRGELVVVEVKTRSGLRYGDPLEAVDDAKLTRLVVLAGLWRRAHPRVRSRGTRVDLVGVLLRPGHEPVIDHLRGAA